MTAALAASILVLVVLGAAVAFRVTRERQAISSRLTQLLNEAERLRTHALSSEPTIPRAGKPSSKQ